MTSRKSAPRAVTIYHEKLGNQHRVMRVEPGKPVVAGDWAHENDVAQLDGLRATTGKSPLLPAGVFRCVAVDHVV